LRFSNKHLLLHTGWCAPQFGVYVLILMVSSMHVPWNPVSVVISAQTDSFILETMSFHHKIYFHTFITSKVNCSLVILKVFSSKFHLIMFSIIYAIKVNKLLLLFTFPDDVSFNLIAILSCAYCWLLGCLAVQKWFDRGSYS